MVSLSINAATNRITTSGFAYNAAGQMTQWPGGMVTLGADYDVDGRLSVVKEDGVAKYNYAYDARNRRVKWVSTSSTTPKYEVYGLGGELLGVYGGYWYWTEGYWHYVFRVEEERIYFTGRVVARLDESGSLKWEKMDRLGSVKPAVRYPFGEGNEWNPNDEYATYPIDRRTGHYYAWHRFYSATWGRFSSPDPYVMSGGLTNPQGWNRYSYVANDPVNYNDPTGLERMPRTFLAPNERTARPIIHKNMAGIGVPTNSDEPFNVGWPISDKRGDSVWLAEFGPDGMEVASETDTTSTQGRKPELDQDCVARVTTAVQKSYQQWRDTLPERVRSAMWRGALYGGLTSLILGGPGFPPGWATGIVGSVTGMVGVAQWEIFIYTPMELAWNFFVTKEFNVDARVQRECNSQESRRP